MIISKSYVLTIKETKNKYQSDISWLVQISNEYHSNISFNKIRCTSIIFLHRVNEGYDYIFYLGYGFKLTFAKHPANILFIWENISNNQLHGCFVYLKAVCTSLKVLFSNGSKRKYSNYTNEEISMIDKSTNTYQFLNLMSVTKVTSFCNYLFHFVFLPLRLFTNSFISNVDVGRRKRK